MERTKPSDSTPKTIAITGTTGLIGSALSDYLDEQGFDVLSVVRQLPVEEGEETFWEPTNDEIEPEEFEGIDAVVHLAGEEIGGGRWTDEKKERILRSRIEGTEVLSRMLADLENPPEVLVSASAVGIYPDRGDEWVDESTPPADNFLGEVCEKWEAAAEPAREAGLRVVHPRIGIVLSPEGGALARMVPAFKAGLGGRIGSGEQYMSWIAMTDVVRALLFLVEETSLEGPVNTAAPNPVINKEFARTLGSVMKRPSIVPTPEFAVKGVLGEMGERLLLSGARVDTGKLQRAGFEFAYPELEPALRHILGR